MTGAPAGTEGLGAPAHPAQAISVTKYAPQAPFLSLPSPFGPSGSCGGGGGL